jgi:hypothetical protein
VERDSVDLERLIGAWQAAFEADRAALRAGDHDLPASELREWTRRLADERVETARLLEAYARDHSEDPALAQLLAA